MKKKMNKKKLLIISGILVLLLAVIIPFGIAVMVYEANFNNRYETFEPLSFKVDSFEGLQADRVTFPTDKAELAGYVYSHDGNDKKGIIVIAHGLGGGGHNTYMDVADYFAANGYYVFGYDATGNDESGGSAVKGLPQGIIDLEHAVQFVKQDNRFANLPIMLFGHSWGAYSSCNVLNIDQDIKAVVSVAGFNKPMDLIEEQGREIAGDGITFMMPYFKLYEWMKFGKYSGYSSMKGFEKSDTGVMVIHSADDNMVSKEKSFDIYYEQYSNDSRFVFLPYEDRGHNYVYYSDESRQYQDEINKQFTEYVDSLGTELTAEIKTEYLNQNLDKEKMFKLDEELMGRMIAFYDSYVE